MPENTVVAFEYAWAQGCDAAEADFRLTADGEVLCMHDETLERTTGDPRRVVDVTLAEAQRLEAGAWFDDDYAGEPVPTLADMLAAVPIGKRILIEIKTGPEILPATWKAITASRLIPDQVVIIAFDEEVIATARRERPEFDAYWLSDFEPDDDGVTRPTVEELIATARRVDATGVDVRADPLVIDAEFVRAVHDAGLELHVWTVNDPDLAVRMMELGVDSITTGRPDLVCPRLQR